MSGIDFSSMPSLNTKEAGPEKPASAVEVNGMSFDFASLGAASEGERIFSPEEEWLKSRWGKFTASEIHRLLTVTEDGSLSDGAVTYCEEKAIELLTEFEPNLWTSREMQWGNEQEPHAVERFIEDQMLLIEKTNGDQEFVLSPDGSWGGTPDGVSPEGLDYGLEIKCPKSNTHRHYKKQINDGGTLKAIKPVYYWQIQASMYLSNKAAWWFMSFDPRFHKQSHQTHYVLIERNEYDIEYMLEKIQLANVRRDMLVSEMDLL